MLRRTILMGFAAVAMMAAAPTYADTADDGAKQFVKGISDRAITVLKDNAPKAQRDETFRAILHDGFATQAIAAFCLGGYWQKASESQRQEYQKLFEDLIVQSYSQRLRSVYNGQELVFGATRPDGKTGTWVSSRFSAPANTPSEEVLWRVRRTEGDQYRVVDVVFANVSLVVTQRDDFTSILQRNGGNMDDFLATLRDKVAKLQSPA
ncbi:MAG: MlaC/ttg2D family ABC transporter substrate-binding protein [Alphaproteobacteria bacterium]